MEEILQEEEPKSRVFILTDTSNRITRIEGEYTLPQDLKNWIQIDEGEGDKYNLAQSHYLEKGLLTDDGIYQYKYENEEVAERTEEEIEEDRQNIPVVPSPIEILEKKINALTPYTETKTAYIGDTNCGFNTPIDGNVSVFFDKNVNGYRVEKDYYARRIVVVFDEPLEEVTEVTISIS